MKNVTVLSHILERSAVDSSLIMNAGSQSIIGLERIQALLEKIDLPQDITLNLPEDCYDEYVELEDEI